MAGFFNRLFGRVPKDHAPSNPEILRSSPQPEQDIVSWCKPDSKNAESVTSQQEDLNDTLSDGSLPNQPYFVQMEHLRNGVTEKDYQKAVSVVE
jgi:hypothetical protein